MPAFYRAPPSARWITCGDSAAASTVLTAAIAAKFHLRADTESSGWRRTRAESPARFAYDSNKPIRDHPKRGRRAISLCRPASPVRLPKLEKTAVHHRTSLRQGQYRHGPPDQQSRSPAPSPIDAFAPSDHVNDAVNATNVSPITTLTGIGMTSAPPSSHRVPPRVLRSDGASIPQQRFSKDGSISVSPWRHRLLAHSDQFVSMASSQYMAPAQGRGGTSGAPIQGEARQAATGWKRSTRQAPVQSARGSHNF